MNILHKFFITLVLIVMLLPITSYADDIDYEVLPNDSIEVISSSITSEIPVINARHAVVFDRLSGTILYGKNENEQCKMASTTKILTAIVVIESTSDLSTITTVSSKAAHTGGSRLGLSTDDKISIHDLLYGLLMVSGNDAAVALAEFVSGTVQDFSELMNQKSNDLGLTSSHFITPHGLDQDEHYTTAFELAKIADYALKNDFFAQIVKTSNYTINIDGNSKNLHNTNELLGYFDGIYGIKTGFTNGANRCLVSSCKRGDLDVICVVLGCDTKKNRTSDSVKLLNYVFNNFYVVNIYDAIDKEFDIWKSSKSSSIKVDKGICSNLNFYLNDEQIKFKKIAINNSGLNKIDINIDCLDSFSAPLDQNFVVGTLKVYINGTEYLSVDILNGSYVKRKNIFDYIKVFFKEYFHYVYF